MVIMVYSLLWVMQDLVHQPYVVSTWPQSEDLDTSGPNKQSLRKAKP